MAVATPESYLADLNEAQREAVLQTEGPLLVVTVLFVRQGRLGGGRHFPFKGQEFPDAELLAQLDPREADIMDAGFRPVEQLLANLDGFETWSKICLEALFGR